MEGLIPYFTRDRISKEVVCRTILDSGQVEIRDVAVGQLPFEYSASTAVLVRKPSGERAVEGKALFGPGYLLVKAFPSRDDIFLPLINELALKVVDSGLELDAVCGNVSGGMIPGYLLKLYLAYIYGRPVRYVYAREMRKQHGSREMLVGVDNNPNIADGMLFGDVEELVNNANTTCNAAQTLRTAGFRCTHAITILDYANVNAIAAREEIGLSQISLVTLPDLLDYASANSVWPVHVIADYRSYLENPGAWAERNMGAIQRALEAKEVRGA